MNSPLAGVKVLDLSRLLPGPFLTMILADLGADVVKIEDPALGDYLRQVPPLKGGMSGRFLAVNRGKRSLELDLKSPSGKAAFLRMVEMADVVVESFRPGVIDRLGLGWDVLSARNPRLILCSLSGYGATGPYAHRAGHDLDYIALAGVLAMGGDGDGAPFIPGVQVADLAGGALWGVAGVLAALYGRERTGHGAALDISMTEGALALLAADLGNQAAAPGTPATRGRSLLNGALACYAVYRCQDGRYLAVGALEPKFWLAFNGAIGRHADPGEVLAPPERQVEIRSAVQAIIGGRPRDEWVALLSAHDACTEPVLELDELSQHPLHAARGVFFTLEAGEIGEIVQVRTPLGRPQVTRAPPRRGEHGREILAEYGFEDEAIAELTAST